MSRYVCIHGHFYQPPRENPWLEEIELQESAYPYHDWNQRVTAECYAPNVASRILNHDNKIINIINNYSKISFNFGPTLLSWLDKKEPDVYSAILDADILSQQNFTGHGSALAQVYNHMIMPLANSRDKETQIVWGIKDFEYRFKRKPEGMWLAETAVDLETLELMAKHGLSESYQIEFVRLKSKIRRIKTLEVDDIIYKLFEKVQHKIIKSAKEFRKLAKIFLRAAANEKELYEFLTNPDMTVSELDQRTLQSGFSLFIEQALNAIASKRKDGIALSSKEKNLINQLKHVMEKLV